MNAKWRAREIFTFVFRGIPESGIIREFLACLSAVSCLNPNSCICQPYFFYVNHFAKKVFQCSIIISLFSSTRDSANFSSAGFIPLLSIKVTLLVFAILPAKLLLFFEMCKCARVFFLKMYFFCARKFGNTEKKYYFCTGFERAVYNLQKGSKFRISKLLIYKRKSP